MKRIRNYLNCCLLKTLEETLAQSFDFMVIPVNSTFNICPYIRSDNEVKSHTYR